MVKQITFIDVGCAAAFDIAFDFLAIVEKIQTWNISNDLNEIDNNTTKVPMTDDDRKKISFDVDKDQQFLQSEGQIRVGSHRRALVFNKSYGNESFYEGYRMWKIQAQNKDKEWYTSDNITIHSIIDSEHKSQYDITIQSNSRDLASQISKDKFPKKYACPALYKIQKAPDQENIEVNMTEVERHKGQLQDELIDIGASFDGEGKVWITIPKGETDNRVKQIMGMMRSMYGFDSKASQDDDNFYIESSEYVFTKIGLNVFLNECKNRKKSGRTRN